MESEISKQCLQEKSTGPYYEPDEYNPVQTHTFCFLDAC